MNKLVEMKTHIISKFNKGTSIDFIGDFNINILNVKTESIGMKLINKLNELGLYPLINKPTRIQKDSATLIDNFFANNFSNCHSIILPYSLSDHMITIKLETIHTKKENEDNFIIT